MLVVFISGDSYLISRDLVSTLERKKGIIISSQLSGEISLLEFEFLRNFWNYIPSNINKIAVPASSISDELVNLCRRQDRQVVSLDPVYIPNFTASLDVTRLTDPRTGEVVIGPRPGAPPLEEQIQRLVGYNSVILADVGAFEGDTLLRVGTLLEEQGITVAGIVLGYSGINAARKINNRFPLTVLQLYQFYEWIELRDLFGIDGRRVPGSDGFIPYWENLTRWASIEQRYENEVRQLCRRANEELLSFLQKEGIDLNKLGKQLIFGGNEQ